MSDLEARIAACGFLGCSHGVRAKGYCSTHLNQQRIKGVMTPIRFNRDDPLANFWVNVNKTGDCWEWTGARNRRGYGRYTIGYNTYLAHRWIFEAETSRDLTGLELDHMCHNPACIRIEHLRPVTHKQNGENLQGSPSSASVGIRGVSFHKQTGKYVARAKHHGKTHSGGLHDTAEAAGVAAQAIRLKLFTHNDADRKPL